jgi:hypothetical protein
MDLVSWVGTRPTAPLVVEKEEREEEQEEKII